MTQEASGSHLRHRATYIRDETLSGADPTSEVMTSESRLGRLEGQRGQRVLRDEGGTSAANHISLVLE